jgi:hypothetical protein
MRMMVLVLMVAGCGGRECTAVTDGGVEVDCGCPRISQSGNVKVVLEVSADAPTCAEANAKCDDWCG